MENEAIRFAKWIATYKSKCEHGSAHEDYFELIEGNWLWKDDEYASYPLSEEQLYEMFQHDERCFHECPICNCRCNCNEHPCSCC